MIADRLKKFGPFKNEARFDYLLPLAQTSNTYAVREFYCVKWG